MAPETDPPDYNHEATWEQGGRPATIAEALAALQQQLPHIAKDSKADIPNRPPHKYAALGSLSHELLPIMGKLGLSFSCKPTTRKGQFGMRYKLRLAGTNEVDKGFWPIPGGQPQAQGSNLTYFRRYTLQCLTGAVAEDDDDGAQAAQAKPQRAAKPRGEANGSGQPDRLKGLITGIQIRYQELGFKRTERDDMLRASETIIGHPLTGTHEGRTHNNLTEVDARKLRDTLGGFKDRGDLLAALVEAATP